MSEDSNQPPEEQMPEAPVPKEPAPEPSSSQPDLPEEEPIERFRRLLSSWSEDDESARLGEQNWIYPQDKSPQPDDVSQQERTHQKRKAVRCEQRRK